MSPTVEPRPGRSPLRPMPVFGCLALIVLAGMLAMVAVGGSFWAWMALAVLILVAGVALVIYLARRNARSPDGMM